MSSQIAISDKSSPFSPWNWQIFSSYAERTGQFALLATCFFIPLSTSMMDLFSVLSCVCWLISGKVRNLFTLIQRFPTVLFSLLLFALLLVGIIYTPASLRQAVDTLAKYRECLYIPMTISLLGNDRSLRYLAIHCFLAGCLLLMTASYGLFFSLLPPVKYGHSLLFHITHSFFMAVLAYCASLRCLNGQYRYFWRAVFLLATVNIFYINPGRTGMVVFVVLILLWVFQHCPWKMIVVGLALLGAALTLAYTSSENFSTRSQQAIHEITNYTPGKSRTSLGQRLDWWNNSLNLIKQAPVFGHGTGSFTIKQKVFTKKKRTKATDNPHNEYLFLAVQTGSVGLVLFVAMFVSQYLYSRKLAGESRFLLQGIVVAMATGCLMNSFLFDSHQGHFYAFLSSLLFSTHPQTVDEQEDSFKISS